MKRIGIFLGITFFLTWTLEFALMANGGLTSSYAIFVLSVVMLMPAISVVATRLITKEGFKDFGLKPHLKGNVRYYLAAWFGPAFLIILGALFYFLIFPSQFDPTMSQMAEVYVAQGLSLPEGTLLTIFITQLAMGIFISPILNIITTSGEEIGWRGYLLPKLMKMYSPRVSIVISGIIWGLWHAPIIAMGHNYGTGYPSAPWGGILAMVVFCLFVGSFFSYLAIKTKSFLPASIAHGSLNGMAAVSVFVTMGNPSPFIGPLPVGIIGGIGFILTGALCFISIGRQQSQRQE
ncbi:CPBP family intramembrane glutamic endopeptidase [Acetobacterium sp. KB-1]|jgi:membrane protease YdiL (CAAX protease family)|uniref:CPBP family intramembrane glutamic endopeptidase n=1 Tax=Acetobacterium sp. KB-1 TaxID=2184575 RepID=UPI000DBEB9BB|nr:type II CAAX endopeptidase family protein [Acetobacterium sp. KB-1]AWW26208.1 CPBP family intramembrane metalloprotease [Acetobacterium sp. KB-1]